jgi:formylglycine-generating enzyme required for sulfatase activity
VPLRQRRNVWLVQGWPACAGTQGIGGGFPLPLMRGQTRNAPRVLRGGAFNNNPRNVRCAYRNNNDPDNRNDNNGFRVVLSTLAAGNAHRA